MGGRDGATQGAIPHMIHDVCTNNHMLYTSSQDHKLILGTHNKYLSICSLDGRARDALNGKNVEAAVVAAAPFSSFYRMQSNSDSHGQHQICLEREIKKKNREKERERVRESERELVGFRVRAEF